MDPAAELNPYAPMPSSSAGEPSKRAPLWPAIVVSLFAYPFAGAGVLLQRPSARRLVWLVASVGLLIAHAFTPPGPTPLTRAALLGSFALWIGGVVVTCLGRPGPFPGWLRILIPAVAVLVVAKIGLRMFVFEVFQILAIE
jgi:hypothetical protein